jgi:hypothetical protein
MNSGFMASGNIADHSTAEEVFALVDLKPKFGSSSSCSSLSSSSSSFSSSSSMHVSGISRSVLSITAFSIPTALTKGRERRRGRERLREAEGD